MGFLGFFAIGHPLSFPLIAGLERWLFGGLVVSTGLQIQIQTNPNLRGLTGSTGSHDTIRQARRRPPAKKMCCLRRSPQKYPRHGLRADVRLEARSLVPAHLDPARFGGFQRGAFALLARNATGLVGFLLALGIPLVWIQRETKRKKLSHFGGSRKKDASSWEPLFL